MGDGAGPYPTPDGGVRERVEFYKPYFTQRWGWTPQETEALSFEDFELYRSLIDQLVSEEAKGGA